MEFSFLYAIPRAPILDNFFLAMTTLAGPHGELCLGLAIVLLAFRKTRKIGAAALISYFGVLLFGQLLLKRLIARPRPCQLDQAFAMLVERPTSSSFPSTHSAWAFGAATAILMNHRKAGVGALVVAALIAFSRLYLFVHFPTDVLAGILLGIGTGILGVKLCDYYEKRRAGLSDHG